MYEKFFKRVIDFILSFLILAVLSPVMLVLIIVGAVAMKGNPFFTQKRPGKIDKKTGEEKIFKLIKFRTMSNKKDKNGNLLPDEQRLNGYGRFLRSTSLDELPELWNILKGDMSLVGPRPLLISYIPYYTQTERMRHNVRPGLTGLAQVNGRNFVSWDNRLAYDVQYVENITFFVDVKIIFMTAFQFVKKQDVAVDTNKVEPNFAAERQAKMQGSQEVHL